jgi:microcystin-dependent protein
MILKNGKRIDGCSDTLPVGTIQPFLGLTPPLGYLVCQGQLISKVEYPELYNICKSTFGAETETHFYLPDLRGKTIAGYDSNDSTMNTIGKLLGAKTHTHTSAAHTHTVAGHVHSTGNHTLTVAEMPSHTHAVQTVSEVSSGAYAGRYMTGKTSSDPNLVSNPPANTGGGGAHNHGNTGSTALTSDSTTPGATGSNTNFQPTVVMNWIVKAAMLIPEYFKVDNTLTSTSTSNALSAAQGKILNDKFNNYLPQSKVADNLTTTDSTSALSAAQGKVLNDRFANYLPLQGGTISGTVGLYAKTQDMGIAFSAYDSSSGAQLSMGIGSSHTDHGIYSDSLDKWLIYANQETGDVIIPRNILIGDTGFTNVGMKMVSNTNGRAILFDNGLMMCMGHVQGTTSSSEDTALGAAKIAYVHCDWTYPQAFKTVYHVMATCDDLDNGFYVAEVDGTPGLSTMRVALGGSASREVGAYVFAIGAWK